MERVRGTDWTVWMKSSTERLDRKVFYDTWAYVALADRGEGLAHAAARKANRLLLEQAYAPLTTNYVVDESLTLLKRRLGHQAALQFLDDLEIGVEAGLVRLEWITPERERAARRLFRRYQDKPKLSMTDCTSFAVMAESAVSLAFTGDDHFERTDPGNFPFRCLIRESRGRFLVRMRLIQSQ